MIDAAIRDLKKEYIPRVTILVGHSGGAAIAADILAIDPELAQAALLVSCPCDVGPWRNHMKVVHPSPLWDQPVESLSPLSVASQVSKEAHIRMIVGDNDQVVPPQFTKTYADRLATRGVDVRVLQIPGKTHNILLEPEVETELEQLEASVAKTASEP